MRNSAAWLDTPRISPVKAASGMQPTSKSANAALHNLFANIIVRMEIHIGMTQ